MVSGAVPVEVTVIGNVACRSHCYIAESETSDALMDNCRRSSYRPVAAYPYPENEDQAVARYVQPMAEPITLRATAGTI